MLWKMKGEFRGRVVEYFLPFLSVKQWKETRKERKTTISIFLFLYKTDEKLMTFFVQEKVKLFY